MKQIIIIFLFCTFSSVTKSQVKSASKIHRPKIKNANTIIVPDQKPVIIEATEAPVADGTKQRTVAKHKLVKKTKKTPTTKALKLSAPSSRKGMKMSKNKPAVH